MQKSKQKVPRNILIKKEPAKTEKAFVSPATKRQRRENTNIYGEIETHRESIFFKKAK